MPRPPAYILAGGQSSRFGQDKARATLDGRPLIQRIAQVVRQWGDEPTVVADVAGKYDDLQLRTIADRRPGLGPLTGLEAALLDLTERLAGPWLLLLSCDLVELDSAWLDALLEAHCDGAVAIAYRPDRWQPLLALYHASLVPEVSARLARQDRSMQSLLDAVETVEVPLPEDWPSTLQVNTPQDLDRLRLRNGSTW